MDAYYLFLLIVISAAWSFGVFCGHKDWPSAVIAFFGFVSGLILLGDT